jgi:hypothetical protein
MIFAFNRGYLGAECKSSRAAKRRKGRFVRQPRAVVLRKSEPIFSQKGAMGGPSPGVPQLRRQMARGQPAWRLESGIATFRRIVSARRGLARGDIMALSAVALGRAWLLSTPASRRPIKGDKSTETAIQPPNSIASDIALYPRSPAMAGS